MASMIGAVGISSEGTAVVKVPRKKQSVERRKQTTKQVPEVSSHKWKSLLTVRLFRTMMEATKGCKQVQAVDWWSSWCCEAC